MLLLSYWSCGKAFPQVSGLVVTLLNCLCGLSAGAAVFRFAPKYQYQSSILIGVLIFASGILRFNEFRKELYKGELILESVYLQGVLEVKQVLKNKGSAVSLRCKSITFFNEAEEQSLEAHDKFFLVFVKAGSPLHFLPGDIIRVDGWLSAIKGPLNPNAFDARVYYITLGIRHQIFCKSDDLKLIEFSTGFSIARMTAGWQYMLTNIIRKNTSSQVAQLTNALLWGDRSDMDAEVRDAFADTGAMHVLSVSGMHVAIIYSMLLLILGPPGAGPLMHRILRFGLYTFAIILYMGLTGACPAVVRAGLMIILYLFGKSMGWHTQVWNLLGFAAFVMLWINPYVWQNIGFQLSFLAMAGILLYAKPIIRSLSLRNKILHLTWEIVALSLAAQVFIIPVLLRQFHQFPLTFIISSIVAIPAAYMMMFGALLNTVLSFIGIDFLWSALDWVGRLFISVMQLMSEWNPLMYYSLPPLGSLFLMMMAILFSVGLVFKWTFVKKIAWLCGLCTLVTLVCHRHAQWTTRDVVIYHSVKGLMMDINDKGYCYSIADCGIPPAYIEFATRGYRCKRDIINVEPVCREDGFENNIIHFEKSILRIGNHVFQIWNKNDDPECLNRKVDYLVIEDCMDINKLKEYIFQNKEVAVILPAQLNRKLRKVIQDFLTEYAISFHDIDKMGYFKIVL